MAVSDLELKCYEYLAAIKGVEEFAGSGIYGYDKWRERIHDEICKLSGLEKSDFLDITNDVERFEDGTELYFAIKERKKGKEEMK